MSSNDTTLCASILGVIVASIAGLLTFYIARRMKASFNMSLIIALVLGLGLGITLGYFDYKKGWLGTGLNISGCQQSSSSLYAQNNPNPYPCLVPNGAPVPVGCPCTTASKCVIGATCENGYCSYGGSGCATWGAPCKTTSQCCATGNPVALQCLTQGGGVYSCTPPPLPTGCQVENGYCGDYYTCCSPNICTAGFCRKP